MPVRSAKERMLADVIAHFEAQGLGDLSLRQIAASIGSSHRMLLYHFGSKDGLLADVVQAVEARTREHFHEIGVDAGADSAEVIRAMWRYVTDPALDPFERLFFALYGRALQGDPLLQPHLAGMVDTWLDANAELAAAGGFPAGPSRAHARLGLAAVRGLLLDRLATGDSIGTDAALELFASRYVGRWWERQSGTDATITVTA